ncbi:nucleotidyltransferase domain-containing protein [Candidatus Gottesmanbacteria bacterium]|nr:nucleotidyltransferase domain-containing protein [Candidatus Gottesmanbacteria bacterium]
MLKKKIILSGYRDSIAHNLHIPREKDDLFGIDDVDFMEFYSFPIEYYLSLEGYNRNWEVEEEKHAQTDIVGYEIRKAFYLLQNCNPNVMLFLYNKPEYYQHISRSGELLLKNRELFISKRRIKEAFVGYANDQLNRLIHGAFRGYMGEKRKRIVKEYGYDTKNATTLIRLLRQGREFLDIGELKVYRDDDRKLLLDVKMGKYSLDKLQKMAKEEFLKVEESYKNSKLPMENNKSKINNLLVKIIRIENS